MITVNSHTAIKTLSGLDGYVVSQFRRKFGDENNEDGGPLRDSLKGQVVAIETCMLSFDAACSLGQNMPLTDETVLERVKRDNVLILLGSTHHE